MIYSLVFPLPVDALGCIDNIDSRSTLVVFYEVVISAFSWRPNASGEGFKGSDLM